MVDSIQGAGGPQNLSAVNRGQNNKVSEDKRVEKAESQAPVRDEVQISQEALALSQDEQAAEKTAKETRTILQEQLDETLSADRQRVDKFL
ncbi:MAG: hypothetical protein H6860_02825 [Rhodospirillales bacterium]|nr:hypothetical protein [Alphaproteobacteria bacterium]MCB9981312.1 hypothetical protein [Rhodospirillales bacterium]